MRFIFTQLLKKRIRACEYKIIAVLSAPSVFNRLHLSIATFYTRPCFVSDFVLTCLGNLNCPIFVITTPWVLWTTQKSFTCYLKFCAFLLSAAKVFPHPQEDCFRLFQRYIKHRKSFGHRFGRQNSVLFLIIRNYLNNLACSEKYDISNSVCNKNFFWIFIFVPRNYFAFPQRTRPCGWGGICLAQMDTIIMCVQVHRQKKDYNMTCLIVL